MVKMSASLHPLLRNLTWNDFDPRCDCTWAGKLVGQTSRQSEGEKYEGLSYYYLSMFVKACSPVSLAGVSYGQIVDWDLSLSYPRHKNGTFSTLATATREHCLKDFCHNLQWQGNPDLSGIGVFTAFTFQAALAVFFILIYLYRGFRGKSTAPTLLQMPLDRCLEIFWVSSFYFGFGMALATASITFMRQASEHTVYFSILGSLVSISVLASLWPWYEPRCAHPHLAVTGMSILYLLVIIVSQIHAYEKGRWFSIFEINCFDKLPTRDKVFFFILTIRWVGWMMMAFTIAFHCLRLVLGRELRKLISVLRYAMSLAAFLVLWISLGFSVQLRSEISDFVDNSYADNAWSFGQILAVVAWVPMVVEFFRIWAWDSMKTHIVPKLRKVLRLQPPQKVSEETNLGVERTEEMQNLRGGLATTLPTRDNKSTEAGGDRRLVPAQEPLVSEIAPTSNGHMRRP